MMLEVGMGRGKLIVGRCGRRGTMRDEECREA